MLLRSSRRLVRGAAFFLGTCILVTGSGCPFAAPAELQGFPVGIPHRIPVMMPEAQEDFRGLLAEFQALFVLHFVDGQVVSVDMPELSVKTAFDPLPRLFRLNGDIEAWGRYSLKRWSSGRLDPHKLRVLIRFQIDKSLEPNTVIYEVHYPDGDSPDSISIKPHEIVIKAPPGDVEAMRESVRKARDHEEHLRQMKQQRTPKLAP